MKQTDVKTGQGYGSMDTEGQGQPKKWEHRGAILTLCIETASKWGKHMVVLTLFIVGMLQSKAMDMKGGSHTIHWPQCKVGGAPYYFSYPHALLCEYLTAYSYGWPPVALAILMLLLSRDMLQKRFWYGMLRCNCAIVYRGGNRPQKDPIILYLLWITANMLAFLLFLFHTVLYHIAEKDEAKLESHLKSHLSALSHGVHSNADDGKMTKTELMVVTTIFLIPSVFVLLDIHSDYCLENSLVPLCQYVHDGIDPQDANQVSSESSLQTMAVWEDRNARELFKRKVQEIDDSALTLLDVYDKLIDLGRKEPKAFTEQGEGHVFLLQSLWPSTVLLKSRKDDAESKHFRILWMVLAFLLSALFALIFVFFVNRIAIDKIDKLRHGEFAWFVLAFVHSINFAFTIVIFGKFLGVIRADFR